MEISTREKLLQTISRYIIITLSISIMTIGVYFFKFPNNFVFGGVTGGAALVAKLTPLSASAFSSWANVILLVLGWIFLSRDFAISTGWATVVMNVELAVFEKYVPLSGPLSDQPMLCLLYTSHDGFQRGKHRCQDRGALILAQMRHKLFYHLWNLL